MTGEQSAASAEALAIFERLCGGIMPAQILSLNDDIDRHLLQLQKLARKDEMMPIDLAEAMVNGLHTLLAELAHFSTEHQSAIIGAALYFISDDDEIPDTASILGLDDDAAIFNHVAQMVGRSDLQVDL